MTDVPLENDLETPAYAGMHRQETVTRGELVADEGRVCERCGDPLPVGTRTFLVGRIGPVDCCCRYCAIADGADEALLNGEADGPA